MNNLAPIVLFVYNRLEHARQTIESLKKNELSTQSDLFIFSDAAKDSNEQDNVKNVREFIRKTDGFKNKKIIERESNFGLAKSIITGVTEIVNQYGKVIVLEDDLFLSEYFLKYMNDALELYENEESVISIHGYIYPIGNQLPETFFIRGADCWGWATWRRGWDLFNIDGEQLLKEIKAKGLENKFNLNGAINYTKMLEDQVKGKNNSWAIRWHASAFLNEKFTLYPGKSLVHNTGNDLSGTHSEGTEKYNTRVAGSAVEIKKIPVDENPVVLKEIENYFKKNRVNIVTRLVNKLRRLFLWPV